MDVARRASSEFLTTAELAAREDFTLGGVIVSPSTRTLRGPAGSTDIEPRVMQVLVVLAESAGQVVTRETLFNRCWGGVFVGDDSLNRAVAAVRRAGAAVGASFEVETIPRTGYRLVLSGADRDLDAAQLPEGWLSRRGALAAGGAAVAMAGGGLWWGLRSRTDARFAALVGSAEQAIRKEAADDKTARDLREAVSLRPGSARAWGLLAFLRSTATASADPKIAEPAAREAQHAARRALAINPKEPYALLAMFELQGSTMDWAARDRRLRQIVSIDPANIPAIAEFVLLTQAAGLNRESWDWNERGISLDPFSLDFLSKRALKLWIAGRAAQADKVIDQVVALYPNHPWPQWARLLILAMSERPRAAQAILDGNLARFTSAENSLWRAALIALDERSAETIIKARQACLQAAETAGGFAADTVMIMSALGEVDAAFEIANSFLLSRGAIIAKGALGAKDDINDATWRINTQYLFTPPCRIMRSDRRFLRICEGMGLTDYWRARGVRPDYQQVERSPSLAS